VLLRVPFGQFEAFLEGVVEARHPHRQEEEHQEQRGKPGEDLEFAAASLGLASVLTLAGAIHDLAFYAYSTFS
jgi:hypothetical protein